MNKDTKYNNFTAEIDGKLQELDGLQSQSIQILYRNLTQDFCISHAKNFFKYFRNKNIKLLHTSWGYCIEEVMSQLAQNKGWNLQIRLPKSIPDFGFMSKDGIQVYADSTSYNTSVSENTHIGGKLNSSEVPPVSVAAADIAYGDDTLNNMIWCINNRNAQQAFMSPIITPMPAHYSRLSAFQDIPISKNPAYKELTKRYGSDLRLSEIRAIAIICSELRGLKLDREDKRNKSSLLKWFGDNLPLIEPILDTIKFNKG